MASKTQYNELLLAEKGRYDILDHEPQKCGHCEFCGTKSDLGYHVRNKETGKILFVGTSCVFVLANLPKYQQLAIKYKHALLKNQEKHAALIAEIKASHEFISLAEYNHWVDENGNNQGFWNKTLLEEAKKMLICKKHGRTDTPFNSCPACLGAAIIYKATKTTKVNPFWIQKYREATA